MTVLEKIEKKRERFSKLRKEYEKEIKELEWEYIQDKYNLTKECVCNLNDAYYLLVDIRCFIKTKGSTILLSFCKILNDGKVSKIKQYINPQNATKVHERLEDYIKTLELPENKNAIQ